MTTKHILARVRSTKLKALGLLALAVIASGGADAAVIVSDDFSFGFGKNTLSDGGVVVPWTRQLYTSSPNTPFTQGSFTFTPSVSSAIYSTGGPLFTDRTITSTGGASGYSGNSFNWGASLAYEYTGPAPVDAAPTPNYRLSLIITSISIYGVKLNQPAVGTLAFSETTAGHTATSSAVTLNNLTSTSALDVNPGQYQKLVWNPDDFLVDGMSGTRSFLLLTETNPVGGLPFGRAVDGFEVFGRVELTYDAIPEPSAIALGVVGLAGVLFFRKRKQLF